MKTLLLLLIVLVTSCSVSKPFDPGTKIPPQKLQEDFTLFRNILEDTHPSLYWYTSKDSLDHSFNFVQSKLTDSMPEYRFRYWLSYIISKIHCGHTAVMPSKAASKFAERARPLTIPFNLKLWPDTAIVTAYINRRDTLIPRGAVITAIEGRPIDEIVDSLFRYLPADGFNLTHKYQTLSNGSSFRNIYSYIYGVKKKMQVDFVDPGGVARSVQAEVYNPAADTPRVRPATPPKRPSKREIKKAALLAARNMRIDTALNTAFMEVSTFSKGRHLRSFFRQSFRQIKKLNIKNLVIDLRSNGGGHVPLSNLLTKYIADKPFKIADSLYAIRKGSKYSKYRSEYLLNQLFFFFMTSKHADGNYHFGLYENKFFKPKTSNHFEGTTYLLTGGNTFSAAALVAAALRPQEDVVIVGEETGGSGYGNTAWLIPEVTLPNTGVRFRLPLFRLVIDRNAEKGRGVMPEVEQGPSIDAIRKNIDYKMEKVIELIKESKGH